MQDGFEVGQTYRDFAKTYEVIAIDRERGVMINRFPDGTEHEEKISVKWRIHSSFQPQMPDLAVPARGPKTVDHPVTIEDPIGHRGLSGSAPSSTIVYPIDFSPPNIIGFSQELQDLVSEPSEVFIDFSQTGYSYPFATLLLAEKIKSFVSKRKSFGLNTSASGLAASSEPLSYLRHIGFFEFIGLKNVGKKPGQAPGSHRYLPITPIEKKGLLRGAQRSTVQEAVQTKSEHLAGMVFDDDFSKQIMLTYCFREIIRNVFEHAQTDSCCLMAQKWYSGEVEIAIVDTGIGILASLEEVFQFDSAEQALQEAIKPGVSRVRSPQRGSEWDNSGFGLYVLSELGSRYGEFSVVSSGKWMHCRNGTSIFNDMAFGGTAIQLKLSTRDADHFPNILRGIVTTGETEHGRTQDGRTITASKRSWSV